MIMIYFFLNSCIIPEIILWSLLVHMAFLIGLVCTSFIILKLVVLPEKLFDLNILLFTKFQTINFLKLFKQSNLKFMLILL